MSWIVLTKKYFGTNGGFDVEIVVDSVDGVVLFLDPDFVSMDGDIMSNIVFLGL